MKEHGIKDSKVTVLQRADDYVSPKGYRITQWECQCECGKIFVSSSGNIRRGITKSCGCIQKEIAHLRTFNDISGKRFGKLVALYRVEDRIDTDGKHSVMWHCVCDCGNEKDILSASLIHGLTKSCGCIQKDYASQLDTSLREYDADGNIIGRICQCCKRMLPLSEYYKSSYTADGYNGVCKYCQAHSLAGRYNVYRKGAKVRKLDFDLTRDEFNEITSRPCNYCGEYSGKYFDQNYSGVDRIDSSLGYKIENVVPCCDMCNRMKLDYNLNTWINKMKKILNHLEGANEQYRED